MSNIIEVSNLKFHWNKKHKSTLDIHSFKVRHKEKIFIQGESGSGKTTLLGLMTGILSPTSGTINVLSKSLGSSTATERDKFRADHLGYIFQIFNLIPYLNIYDNIYLPLQFSKHKYDKYKNKEEIKNEIHRITHKLKINNNLLNKKITELSFGQQQRVSVARALIGKPEIIIADEPTSALDSHNRKLFINLLLEECELNNTTVVFVSHDPYLAKYFDKNIHMEDINASHS